MDSNFEKITIMGRKVDDELERLILLMMHTPTVSNLLYRVYLSVLPKSNRYVYFINFFNNYCRMLSLIDLIFSLIHVYAEQENLLSLNLDLLR